MTEAEFEELLREVGALKEGHFLLASGRHSDRYVEKFDLLRQPRMTEQACAEFVRQVRDWGVDVVAGPTTGGILLAFEVARQLGVAAAYAERAGDGSAAREFRRGTQFPPGARVLVVDDILTTGGSVRETLAALAREDVQVLGIAVLVDRSGGRVDFGVPLLALARMDIATWEPADCPLCREGVPLVKPGTTTASGGAPAPA
ncbi:MAG: orotate phosphoribosyltransferase [Sphaerobacter sp.]|nr:orotate phosphoribosyltransferase [Sphaerobacter sp.]